jgi:lysylphosphatidylglycerol synthetase-like protein (DUF2156 family)
MMSGWVRAKLTVRPLFLCPDFMPPIHGVVLPAEELRTSLAPGHRWAFETSMRGFAAARNAAAAASLWACALSVEGLRKSLTSSSLMALLAAFLGAVSSLERNFVRQRLFNLSAVSRASTMVV